MKKLLNILFLLAGFYAHSQTIMNIYQNNGSVLQIPLSSIDSITYTIGNPGQLATLTTLPIGNIASTSATSGGNITNNGGSPVTQRGVVWSTSQNPTTANSKTTDGSGTGNYTSNLTGLAANTTYYVRAYATNSAGTAYGNETQFFTGGSSSSGSISAYIQGNTNFSDLLQALTRPGLSQNYLTYLDGSGPFTLFAPTNSAFQNLLAELGVSTINDIPAAILESVLRYHIVNGTLLAGSLTQGQTITTLQGGNITVQLLGGAWLLDNNGRVANITAVDISATNGVKHIIDKVLLPTTSGVAGSITALNCNNATNNGTLSAGTAASGVSSTVPYTGGNGGSYNGQTVNSTGVTGLTATLTAGNFANGAGSLTYTITGTPSASGTANFALNIGGQSCVLARTVSLPVGFITALNCNSATNNGTLSAGTAASGVSSTVPYTGGNGGSYNGQTVNSTGVTGLTATLTAGNFANGAGSLTYTITGTPSAAGTANFPLNITGQICTLRCSINPLGGIVSNPGAGVTFNGYTYSSVVLGNGQEWMAENLRTTTYRNGDPIPNVTDSAQWLNLTTGAWAHQFNNSQYENPYGKLYNWYTVADPRNVCPTGWHVPTDAEWTVLTDYLGGELVAGGKMKSTGTQYWQSPNTDATNESGFSGAPGGVRGGTGIVDFGGIGSYGYWWSSTQDLYELDYNKGSVFSFVFANTLGLSVRCVRD